MLVKALNKFSKHLKYSLHQAAYSAASMQHRLVEPPHLLLGFLRTDGALATELLTRAKADPAKLEEFIKRAWPEINTLETLEAEFSAPSQKLLINAAAIAANVKHPYIGTEHLLAAILDKPGSALAAFLKHAKWPIKDLRHELALAFKNTSRLTELTDTFTTEVDGENKDMTRDVPPALAHFGTHLTDPAHAATLDPVVGREKEIDRLLHILARRTKNNPVLLGDPGVGKTAVVEGLAKRLAEGQAPPVLRHIKIVALDVGSIVAGTMFRGEFENRMKQLVDELKSNPHIVVFIDELHTIVGAGSAAGAIDASNLLKPALARGDIRCIGATTLEEYRQHIETDGALERRFQPIIITEPTAGETLTILQGLKPYYENHHGVVIGDEALQTAVALSERYLPDRFLPDKAIDLVDEAAARIKIQAPASPEILALQEIENQEFAAARKKDEAVMNERFEEALRWKNELNSLSTSKQALAAEINKQIKNIPLVDRRAVVEVLTNWTRIPVADIVVEEQEKLATIEQRLRQTFVGHDPVVKTIVQTLQRSGLGLTDRRRPLASFLLIGPSGVGKTTLARAIARALFNNESALLFLDMSEFSEGFTVSKLIGAPAGYVGFRESGILTERVRRQPYQVICFDELDRAHRDVSHLLLQVLGEGSLREATGRQVNFTQTIIVATVNPNRNAEPISGFGENKGSIVEGSDQRLMSSIYDILPTELVARFDAVLPMTHLTKHDYGEILKQALGQINERLGAKGVVIRLSQKAAARLIDETARDQRGARALQQKLREVIELPLAERLLLKTKSRQRVITLHSTGSSWRLSP